LVDAPRVFQAPPLATLSVRVRQFTTAPIVQNISPAAPVAVDFESDITEVRQKIIDIESGIKEVESNIRDLESRLKVAEGWSESNPKKSSEVKYLRDEKSQLRDKESTLRDEKKLLRVKEKKLIGQKKAQCQKNVRMLSLQSFILSVWNVDFFLPGPEIAG
jgi:hypothetical protein